jgi:hypothetical protein
MEIKNVIIGVGVLAVGGYLAWKYLKKPNIPTEEPIIEPKKSGKISQESTKLSTSDEDVNVKPPTNLNTKAGGSTPVKGITIDPNVLASAKSPFVTASVMKNLTIRTSNGDIVNLKRGDKISVANTYGDSPMTYLEGSSSQKFKWDVDVYFPRTGTKTNTTSGVGGEPQFDGGKKKGHNFPYFY